MAFHPIDIGVYLSLSLSLTKPINLYSMSTRYTLTYPTQHFINAPPSRHYRHGSDPLAGVKCQIEPGKCQGDVKVSEGETEA